MSSQACQVNAYKNAPTTAHSRAAIAPAGPADTTGVSHGDIQHHAPISRSGLCRDNPPRDQSWLQDREGQAMSALSSIPPQ